MAMATLRWMGAPESEVKLVEAMYENTTGRVVVGSGMSKEFQVNIDLRPVSALSPLLFILVMGLISRKISTTDVLKKNMYADDLVIVAEHQEKLQGALEEWNDMFMKHSCQHGPKKMRDVLLISLAFSPDIYHITILRNPIEVDVHWGRSAKPK